MLTAGLEDHTLTQGVTVAVGARRSTPAQAILPLKYNTGTITAEIAMEGTDICPSVDNLNGDVLQLSRANVIVSNIQMNSDTCVVSAEVPIGLVQTTLAHPGFESYSTVSEVLSAQTTDLGLIRLARAKGRIIGQVELQGIAQFSGVQIEVVPVNNAELPTYTTTTAADGGFSIDSVWAGRYHVWAEKEGYNRKRIGENVIVSQDSTVDIADDADVLSQQTGDFLINEGASFTNLANVTLYLTFNDISEFRIRTNDGAFSDWIQWSDEDQDGAIHGTNDEVLSSDQDEADTDRLVEPKLEPEGINSGAPYYQATIRLDIDPLWELDLIYRFKCHSDRRHNLHQREFG